MTFHCFLLLLSFFFILCLAWLWHLDWSHHDLPHQAAKTAGSAVHRLLKPRSPRDCPACRLSHTLSSRGEPAPHLCAPGARSKAAEEHATRVNTEGFACPNLQCLYFGITDAHMHALVGDGTHGHAERIQTFRGPACRTTFTRPSQHSPVPSENPLSPDRHGADLALAEGLDPSEALRVAGLPTSHHHQPF